MKRVSSGESAPEEGMYICHDGCERRYYRAGEELLTCAMQGGATTWIKVEEQ